ncbi:35936_t:CDS:2 [Gigaspora margarita]|uniref:35936_t:CDS:1 n=1 Tax=Gigaspora margarita TaxID=4874 RepID=A0ABN7UWV4_GIGMA|nr:35936_t:CDS:2 [Gigaspora margarita]
MARLTTQKLQLWLVDQYLEEGSIIVNTTKIIKKINISIIRTSSINNIINSLYIKEILYKNNSHWKLQDVNLDYMHPCEYSTLIALPPEYNNLKVLKLFIDIYYNDFGGVYVQLGNMPFDIRKHLRNHFILGFVPFGGSFDDFIHLFVLDMNQLEKGVLMNIQGNDYWIIAGLGCVTADLPQGNDLVGVKCHSAIGGCRTCLVAKDNATNENLDIAMISRYHHITNVQFEGISIASTFAQRDEISKKYSLRNSPPILDQLQYECHLQSPQDTYHLIARITLKLLKLTISMLSLYGEQKFLKS